MKRVSIIAVVLRISFAYIHYKKVVSLLVINYGKWKWFERV
jgi:hypothetical protein